jgi:hypothetical protein
VTTPKFSQHNTLEVTESYTESKQIAAGLSENYRFSHRMKALLLGDINVRPMTAVRLSGLPGKLSGYWVVLSVTHLVGKEAADAVNGQIANFRNLDFNNYFSGRTPYLIEVELGIDTLGDTTGKSIFKSPVVTTISITTGEELGTRDIQADLDSTISPSSPSLNTVGVMLSLSSEYAQYGVTQPTSNTVTLTPSAPNFGVATFDNRWEASNG